MSVNHESEEYLIELLRVRDMARVEAKLYRASARHYRRLNMSDCGIDRERDNMMYFEWYQPERRSRIVDGETVDWEEELEETQERWEDENDV
jgi:hypothetical protein